MKLRIQAYFIAAIVALGATAQEVEHNLQGTPLHEIYASNMSSVTDALIPSATLNFLETRTEDDYDYALANDMIEYAKTFIGTRYRRGGKTPAGFDCSGFTSYIFCEFGYSLGASSSAQALQGVAVETEDILPGDLVIFNGRRAGGRVGHVGIAIDYDHETGVVTFIHSAISGGIRIDKTSQPYYKARFLGARRVL